MLRRIGTLTAFFATVAVTAVGAASVSRAGNAPGHKVSGNRVSTRSRVMDELSLRQRSFSLYPGSYLMPK